MDDVPFKICVVVTMIFSGLFVAKKLWRDELGFMQRTWTETFVLIALFSVTVLIVWIKDNYKKNKKKNIEDDNFK